MNTNADAIISALSALSPETLSAVLSALSAATPTSDAPTSDAHHAPHKYPVLDAIHAHNAQAKKTYKLCADDMLARITLSGVNAYYAATLDEWSSAFDGSAYAIISAQTVVKDNKRGKYLEVVVKSANFGTLHITTNSTTSIDYRRLTASYVKRCDKRADKSSTGTPNTGRRAPMSDVKRAAQAVNRYAAAAVKRLDGDKRMHEKVRTLVVNKISSECVERDVNRDEVIAALNDKTRAFVS
ncbi:MAG: hypothetical protein IJG82_09580 [Atopobiaceae bacterium]|nr:hypothetical protein [Atopobiaceae bacterium]